VERGLADGVLVTGSRTGMAASLEKVREAVKAAGQVPVWVASGVTAANATGFLTAGARGLIVGTSIKRGGRTEAMVDRVRAAELVRIVRSGQRPRRPGDSGKSRGTARRP
jgi:predicted TIM-barrel enzyme